MEGALKKLRIEAYTDPRYGGDPKTPDFEVMFNPNNYSVKYAVEYEEDQGKSTTGLPQKYKQTKPIELSLDFVIDGTGASADKVEVIEKVREFLQVVKEFDGEIHRPPYLKISWGSLLFNCVFKSANVKYVLFKPNGEPLRANIAASFGGFVDDTKRAAKERASSADLTRVHAVLDGETLPLISQRFYGNPGYYIYLAEVNALDDFRSLQPGQTILCPPLRA